jgi:hypothetical protein
MTNHTTIIRMADRKRRTVPRCGRFVTKSLAGVSAAVQDALLRETLLDVQRLAKARADLLRHVKRHLTVVLFSAVG